MPAPLPSSEVPISLLVRQGSPVRPSLSFPSNTQELQVAPPANLADHAAATAAGTGQAGSLSRHYGESSVSQAAADAQALASLNGFRNSRYNGVDGKGNSLTTDFH